MVLVPSHDVSSAHPWGTTTRGLISASRYLIIILVDRHAQHERIDRPSYRRTNAMLDRIEEYSTAVRSCRTMTHLFISAKLTPHFLARPIEIEGCCFLAVTMAQRRSVSNHSSSSSMSQAAPATDDGLAELLAPDGYYTYLEIPRESSSSPTDHSSPADPLTAVSIDKDLVKKNYRRLSRKHHPDRPNGSADTFRILHRAHKVLLDDKLRQQYDLLGIDLDEDEHDDNDHHEQDETTNTSNDNQTDNETDAEGKTDKPDGKKKQPKETPTILQELATTVMAAIMQVMVRTGELYSSGICRRFCKEASLTPCRLFFVP